MIQKYFKLFNLKYNLKKYFELLNYDTTIKIILRKFEN